MRSKWYTATALAALMFVLTAAAGAAAARQKPARHAGVLNVFEREGRAVNLVAGGAAYAPIAQCPAGYQVVGTGFTGPMLYPQGGLVLNYGTFVAGFFEVPPVQAVQGGGSNTASVQAICAQDTTDGSPAPFSGYGPDGPGSDLGYERAAYVSDLAAVRSAGRNAGAALAAIARRHHGTHHTGRTGRLDVVTVAGAQSMIAPGTGGFSAPAQCPAGYRVTGTGFLGPMTFPQGGLVLNYGTYVKGLFDQIATPELLTPGLPHGPAPAFVQATCAKLVGPGHLKITTVASGAGNVAPQSFGPSNGEATCPAGWHIVGTGFFGPMTNTSGGYVHDVFDRFVAGYFSTYSFSPFGKFQPILDSEPAQSPDAVQATCATITA